MKKIKKEHVAFILGALVAGTIVGSAWVASDYIKSHVPYFVWSNGLKYAIHYLQGKDAVDEIYKKIGIGK